MDKVRKIGLKRFFSLIKISVLAVVSMFAILIIISVLLDKNKTSQPSVPTPLSSQERLTAAVNAQIKLDSSQFTYKNITIAPGSNYNDSHYPLPKDAEYVTVDINMTDVFWNDSDIVTSTGKLASSIFQRAFPVDNNFYDIAIRYFGDTTDQYGKTTNGIEMTYDMDRPLYSKIDWAGFADVENDIHLCAFLREEFSTMSKVEKDTFNVECVITPYNLQNAEKKIETTNP